MNFTSTYLKARLAKLFGCPPSQAEGKISVTCLGALTAPQLALVLAGGRLAASDLMACGGEAVSISKTMTRRSGLYADKHDGQKETKMLLNKWATRLLTIAEKGLAL
jgi:hypothetical protein